MTAFSIIALVGQFAHRRLMTDDGMSAAAAADFIVDLLLKGLLPRPGAAGTPRHGDSGPAEGAE